MFVEDLSSVCSGLDLGRNDKPKCCQLSDFSQQSHQLVAVVNMKLSIFMAELHQTTGGL